MSEKKCPACGWVIGSGAVTVEVEGRNVVTCCQECADEVRANPRKRTEEA